MGWMRWAVVLAVLAVAGCGGGGGTAPAPDTSAGGDGGGDGGGDAGGDTGGDPGGGGGLPAVEPPATAGAFRVWSAAQGLSAGVSDVSADEAGNVYVAAGDAVFAKTRGARDFTRFDADAAGLTKNCYQGVTEPTAEDPAPLERATPPGPPTMCPVISVAGATANRALIGFKGHGTDGDRDADWAVDSGGADVVAFDGTALRRERHVFVATPPGYVCEFFVPGTDDGQCYDWDPFMLYGRRKMRQVQRIAVNHDAGRPISHGDAIMGGTHASFAILVANPEARGWQDLTRGDAAWAEAKDVFEHEHPAIYAHGRLLTGEAWALAFDPTSSVPWYANEFRMASLPGYASMTRPSLTRFHGLWWGNQEPPLPHLWIWEAEPDPDDPAKRDGVQSIAFCDDGTMWVGSDVHGLAYRSKGAATFTEVGSPPDGGGVLALACDPLDGSVWVGLAWGGFARYRGGRWLQDVAPWEALPPSARGPVRSIQIDRWASPRIVYLAHVASKFGPGAVTAYDGP